MQKSDLTPELLEIIEDDPENLAEHIATIQTLLRETTSYTHRSYSAEMLRFVMSEIYPAHLYYQYRKKQHEECLQYFKNG